MELHICLVAEGLLYFEIPYAWSAVFGLDCWAEGIGNLIFGYSLCTRAREQGLLFLFWQRDLWNIGNPYAGAVG